MRTLFSTILLVLIVLTVFCIVAYRYSYNQYKKDIISTKMAKAREMSAEVSSHMNEMLRIVIGIDEDYTFSYTPYNSTFEQGNDMVKRLETYQTANSFINDIAYYRMSEPEKIYTTNGQTQLDLFFKHLYTYETLNTKNFYSKISSAGNLYIHPAEDVLSQSSKNNIITFSYALPMNMPNPKRFVIFMIGKEKFDEMTASLYENDGAKTWVYDHLGKMVYTNDRDKNNLLNDDYIKHKLKGKQTQFINIKGQKYLILSYHDDANNWSYLHLLNVERQMKFFYVGSSIYVIIFLIGLIILSIFAFLVAIFNYRPLYQLINKLSTYTDKQTDANDYDEMRYIETVISQAINKKRVLSERLFFSNLIWGQFDDISSLKAAMSETDIHMNFDRFLAVLIKFNNLGSLNKEISVDIGSAIESSYIKGYCIEMYDKSSICIIFNYHSKYINEEMIPILTSELIDGFRVRSGLQCVAGIGLEYNTPLEIVTSFSQARQAVLYNSFNDQKCIAVFEDMTNRIDMVLTGNVKMDLAKSVRQGKCDAVNEKLNKLKEQVIEKSFSPLELKNLCYILMEYLQGLIEALPEIDEKVQNTSDRLFSIDNLTEEILFAEFTNLCIDITKYYGENKPQGKNEKITKIFEFIENKLFDYSLSLESIAEACGVTPAYLGRYFKQQTGETPIQYVDKRRLAIAKELLANTDLPLKQIISRVGFVDESNFIRKFKKLEGITPISYRRKNAE
ncbi:MAG: helix-turn-helix domain-containing protein [Bacillota bacterium]|nr:helix-turn-helix domain-containing protein [Bacillota bacterium]